MYVHSLSFKLSHYIARIEGQKFIQILKLQTQSKNIMKINISAYVMYIKNTEMCNAAMERKFS